MEKHTYLSNFQVKWKESINTMSVYNRINNTNNKILRVTSIECIAVSNLYALSVTLRVIP